MHCQSSERNNIKNLIIDNNIQKIKELVIFENTCVNDILWDACYYEKFEIVMFLISRGADIRDNDDLLVRWLCGKGKIKSVKLLISLGADVRKNDHNAIVWACENGHLEMVKFLVSLGLNIRCHCDNAFRWSCINGHLDVVKYIVKLTDGSVLENCKDFILTVDTVDRVEVADYLVSKGYPYEFLNPNGMCKKYIDFKRKMIEKVRHRAAKKIYYWIIPKLYSPNSESAYRLGLKGYEECMNFKLN